MIVDNLYRENFIVISRKNKKKAIVLDVIRLYHQIINYVRIAMKIIKNKKNILQK